MHRTVLNQRGYGILRKELNNEQERYLKENLTVKPNVIPDYDFGDNKPYPVYRFNTTRYYVPKFWGIQQYGQPEYVEESKCKSLIDFKFNGTLRDYQEKFTENILQKLKTDQSCIGCAKTGSGKTICSLWLVSQLKKRTLVIVHKEFLLDQWIERINQFLPEASVGIIRQNVIETDKDIVIGMIQSITMRDYDQGTFDDFGLVIADECHHLPSRVFSKLFYKIGNPTYKLGLSATPQRKDGLTKVLEWFLGEIIINHKKSDIEVPEVKFVEAKYTSKLVPKYYNWNKKLITSNMETQIASDKGRTNQIIEEILNFSNQGRKILVLSSRRGHCEEMKNILLKNPLFRSGNLKKVGLYLGGMTEAQLTLSNQCDVILATYSMAYEGYDNPDLDTLIMATGRGDIEQACGRILRRKNLFRPLIIDFTDPQWFGGQLARRKAFYRKHGYLDYNTGKKLKKEKVVDEAPEESMFED